MKLLLPVDSRVANTQGFIILNTSTGELTDYETIENLNYSRKGFRGGCVVDKSIFVCNSYSVKQYNVDGCNEKNISFSLVNQIHFPEWLIGRGANADLHMLHYEKSENVLFLANSYMDCIDILTLSGKLVDRKFLWEISSYINKLVSIRNPKAADLCHINHIENLSGKIIITLGNVNGTGMGCVIDYETGDIIIDNLHRPHDGVYSNNQYFLTETSKKRILIYDDIYNINDLRRASPRSLDLSGDLAIENNNFWVRGIYANQENIFIACSQFQDRDNDNKQALSSHIIISDRESLIIKDRLWVPSVGKLERPVLYSIIKLNAVLDS